MLDIHKFWFIVLVINFLGLLYILNIIFYRPLLKIFKEREDTVKGSLDAAKEMDSKKEEGIATMNRELAGARSKAREVFESIKSEGSNKQKEMLSEAAASADGLLQKAREELRAEVEKARAALKADVEKFSDEIVRKLVKA